MDPITLFIISAFCVGFVFLLGAFKGIIFAPKKYHNDVSSGYWFSADTFRTNVATDISTITGEPKANSSISTNAKTDVV